MFLRSVVKIPCDVEDRFKDDTAYRAESVPSLHDEAAVYQFLDNQVESIPQFLGFNNSAEILHVGFVYSDIQDVEKAMLERPIETTAAALHAVQELHEHGVVHNDLFIDQNFVITQTPKGTMLAKIIDLGEAEIFPNPENNPDFIESRRWDLYGTFNILVTSIMIKEDTTRTEDAVEIMATQMGLKRKTAETIGNVSRYMHGRPISLEETNTIIVELEKLSRPLAHNNDIVSPKDIQTESAFTDALEKMREVNEFLMEY